MSATSQISSKRVLDPMDRISEVLFGLIMVLTFTGSLSVAEAARDDIRAMLIGALGCNLAWGVIDGVFYLMSSLAEKSRGLILLQEIRKVPDPQQAQRILVDALPPVVASVVEASELEMMRQRLIQLPEQAMRPRWDKADWQGALGVFLLVFLATFPPVIPFMFMREVLPAMRVSNLIAVALLFLMGYAFGRQTGRSPWVVGVTMVIVGSALVAITMALGG